MNSVSKQETGTIMGIILSFDFDRSRRTPLKHEASSNVKGTILFFTGVRYVRELGAASDDAPTQSEDPTRPRRKRKRA